MNRVELYSRLYQDPGYAMGHQRLQLVAELAKRGLLAGRTVLDVGCGRGETRAVCLEAGAVCWRGAEIVPALAQLPDRVLVASGAVLPFVNANFDVVLCYDVLEHLDGELEVRDVLRELHRVTQGGGRLYGSVAWFRDTRVVDDTEIELHTIQKSSLWWIGWLQRCGWSVLRETESETQKWLTFEALKP